LHEHRWFFHARGELSGLAVIETGGSLRLTNRGIMVLKSRLAKYGFHAKTIHSIDDYMKVRKIIGYPLISVALRHECSLRSKADTIERRYIQNICVPTGELA